MNTVAPIEIIKDRGTTRSVNPKKFILWLIIVTIVMLFASLTSAYIVRQSDGNWLRFDLPQVFWFTSAIILLSSFTMHSALRSARKDSIRNIRLFLSVTLGLGIIFLAGQYYSWIQLIGQDIYFVGNPSGSFLYVLTGLHAVHLISGIVFLSVVLIGSLKYKIHSRNLIPIEMCATYWHFLGGLWIYLFIFLNLYQ
jgi:cytochrome c oxidase subunit 3